MAPTSLLLLLNLLGQYPATPPAASHPGATRRYVQPEDNSLWPTHRTASPASPNYYPRRGAEHLANAPPGRYDPADEAPGANLSTRQIAAPRADEPPPGADGQPSGPSRAEAILAEFLALPQNSALVGQPLALIDVLRSSYDRSEQLHLVRDYWALCTHVARYHARLRERDALAAHLGLNADDRRTRGAAESENRLTLEQQARWDAARARTQEAWMAAVEAQHTLATRLRWPLPTTNQPTNERRETAREAQLPLPADVPHTGVYHTRFDQIFAGRPTPPRALLLERKLPVELQAVDLRARAVDAAADAVEGHTAALEQGQAQLDSVLAAWGALADEQHRLFDTVQQYNNDIAEYALLVAVAGTNPEDLLAMLIRRRPAGRAERRAPVNRAAYTTDLYDRWSGPPVNPAGTPAPPYDPPPDAGWPDDHPQQIPSDLDAATSLHDLPADHPSSAPSFRAPPLLAAHPDDFLPRSEPAPPASPYEPPQGWQADEPTSLHAAPVETFARDPRLAQRTAELSAEHFQLSDLRWADTGPHRRSQRLALALHHDWPLHDNRRPSTDQPISLEQCLGRAPTAARAPLVEAYWKSREQFGRQHVHSQQVASLEQLANALLALRTQAGIPEAMLDVQRALWSAKADQAQQSARCLDGQFELTQLARGSVEGPWWLPVTSPHGGRYLQRLSQQPRWVASADRVVWLSSRVQGLETVIAADATAAVTAMRHRGQALRAVTSAADVRRVLAAQALESESALRFASLLTRYNVAIADYALAVLPAQYPARQLVDALVLPQGLAQRSPRATNRS